MQASDATQGVLQQTQDNKPHIVEVAPFKRLHGGLALGRIVLASIKIESHLLISSMHVSDVWPLRCSALLLWIFFSQTMSMTACSDAAELFVALKQWALRKLGRKGEAGSSLAGAGQPQPLQS